MKKLIFLWVCLLLAIPCKAKADQNLVELAEKVRPAVVLIETFDRDNKPVGQGSGFFINDKGHLITNHHVIEGAYSATIKTVAGKKYLVERILATEPASDVAKLLAKVNDVKVSFLTPVAVLPSVGEDIAVVGNPFGLESTLSKGIVSAIRPIPDFGHIIQISAPISDGSSGSPVLNVKGEVIGVATFILIEGQALNFAVPSKKIMDLKTYETIQQFPQYLQILKEKRADEAQKPLTAAQKEILQKAETGDSNAMCELGEMYRTGKSGFARDYTKAIEWLQKAADAGNILAMLNLAQMYSGGLGVAQNMAEVVEWLRKAVEAGSSGAMLELARIYEFGVGEHGEIFVPKDSVKAVEFYRKAAEAGSEEAMLFLGRMYYSGRGVKQDCTKAFEWISKAANKTSTGFPSEEAKFFLALLYHEGCGVPKDDAKTLDWLRKANESFPNKGMVLLFSKFYGSGLINPDKVIDLCVLAAEAGESGAMLWLGTHYQFDADVKDIGKALEWFEKGAAAGNASCMFWVGMAYSKGEGVGKDYVKAVEWFRKAAEAGHSAAMLEVGLAYKKGEDYPNAVKWFRKAIEAGNVTAMFYLALAYQDGEGVAKDVSKAIEWYTKATEKGEITSMYNLGVLYLKGEGVTQDYTKAFEWFWEGAMRGNVEAMAKLGGFYYFGKGVTKDSTKAMEWWNKAAAADNCHAIMGLAVAYELGEGVPKDKLQAIQLYKRAARLGDENAKKTLVKLGETW